MELGKIQEISICNEGFSIEPGGAIWFVQEERKTDGNKLIRNIQYEKLVKQLKKENAEKEHKISNVLTKVGFEVLDPKAFEHELKELFREKFPKDFPRHPTIESK